MGVNQIRNRGYYHVAVWDEYGQRLQYLALIPSMLVMFPSYYYGSWINRDLERNFASSMYGADYENRRNRLTHSLIFEHFEKHVEDMQGMLGELDKVGFEEYFAEEIETGGEGEEEVIPKFDLTQKDPEYLAQFARRAGIESKNREERDHEGTNFWMKRANQLFEPKVTSARMDKLETYVPLLEDVNHKEIQMEPEAGEGDDDE